MKSEQKSRTPIADFDLAQHFLGSTPFLDVTYLFGVDISQARKNAFLTNATHERSVSFEEFAKRKVTERSSFAKSILSLGLGNKNARDDAWEALDISTDYVLGLDGKKFPGQQLVEHYGRFSTYCQASLESNSYESGPHISITLIQPVLRWMDAKRKPQRDCRAALDVLELVHEEIVCNLTQGRFSSSLLEFLNMLTFSYLVISEALKIGIPQPLTCDYLRVIRRATASDWIDVPERVRLQHAALSLHLMKAFFPLDMPFRTQLGFSQKTLADFRNVMASASQATPNAAVLSHLWVFRWVRDKLDSEVFSTRLSASGLTGLSDSEQQTVVELARRFGNYRFPVTVDHLASFLAQFGSTQRIRGALRLLTHTKFYPLWELAEAIERLLREETDRGMKITIAPSGDRTGSTSIINYLASHSSLSEQLVFAEDLYDALKKTKRGDIIYFIDDCLLSGTQTLSVLGDLMGTRVVKAHHTRYCDPLPPRLRKKLAQRRLRFAYCIATDIGLQRMKENLAATGLDPERVEFRSATVESALSKVFDPLGPVGWASQVERDELKSFVTDVGYEILGPRASRKGWDDNRRRESALGFSDFQRLLVFPYNVPKTTLTFLWERGNNEYPWLPLFPGAD